MVVSGGWVVPQRADVTVTVKPYFGVTVEINEWGKEIPPGGTATFTFTVRNIGNAMDSFMINITNKNALTDAGWVINLTRETIYNLPPGENRTCAFRVKAPDSLAPYKNSDTPMDLKVSSIGARALSVNESTLLNLTIKEKGFSIPGTSILVAVMIIVLGVAAGTLALRRKKRKGKTVKDYKNELNLDKGD
jgi:uncharacterized membrane protein